MGLKVTPNDTCHLIIQTNKHSDLDTVIQGILCVKPTLAVLNCKEELIFLQIKRLKRIPWSKL